MKLRRRIVVGAGIVAALAVPFSVTRAATNPPITFTHEVTVDPNRDNGEPGLAITDDGNTMFTDGPWGFSTTVSMAWKSSDGGVQWDLLHGDCPANPLRPFCSRGGGDAEAELGTPQGSGQPQALYYADLNGLDTISCAYSNDLGKNFTISGDNQGEACNVTSGNPSGTDRPWIAVCRVGQPCAHGATADQVYMVYDTGETLPGDDAALRSTDGGHTWTSACDLCVRGNGLGSRPGPLLINQVTGTLYEFMGTATGFEVNISCDGASTWQHVDVSGPSGTGSVPNENDFVVGAIDSQGGIHVAYAAALGTQPWRVYYSHTNGSSTPGGTCTSPVLGGAAADYSAPIAINNNAGSAAPGVHFAVMPAIAAGDPGRVDIAYYGTTHPVDGTYAPDSAPGTWFLHMAQTLDGGLTWSDTQASETPMHVQSICFLGISCTGTGDRNLIDFFEVRPDPSGRAVIIFTDDNNTQPGPPVAGFPGAGLISEVQQASGPGLFATVNSGVVSGPSSGLAQSLDIRNEVTDPAGDAALPANQPATGSNVDAADLTDLKVVPNGSTLQFKFTVKNLGGGPASAVVNNAATAAAGETHTGAIWLATWHFANDFWFASVSTDAAGNLSCLAGRPLDVFSSSAPKALQYVQDPQGTENHAESGCSASGNTLEVDVPLTHIGTPATTDVLYGLTGYTADTAAAQTVTGITGGTAPGASQGNAGFFDNIDQTAPIDVPLTSPATNTPEVPAVPLLAGLGVAAALGGAVIRRRRDRAGRPT
jgi:hypothetical protein